jgi:hypothetical protein
MKIFVLREEMSGRVLLVCDNDAHDAVLKGYAWFTDDVLKEEMDSHNRAIVWTNKSIQEHRQRMQEHDPQYISSVPTDSIPLYTDVNDLRKNLNLYVEHEIDFDNNPVVQIDDISL